MADIYNYLPELTRDEKLAVLDRAVQATFEVHGIPRDHAARQAFDLSVDLQYTMGCFMLQQAFAAQARQLEDEAALDEA